VKQLLTSPKFITITIAILALIVVPFTLIEIQSPQSLRQNAETILWQTNQSASSACASNGSGALISATFTNTEPRSSSMAMDVTVKDVQTGKTANMGSILGGDTRTVTIATGKNTLSAGSVTFALSWSDGHNGTDSRSASYKEVSNCIAKPTPTPTNKPTPTPTVPPGQPTPTICPTLSPVKNVHINCPNCQLTPSPNPSP
jgi:hypothetical protein